MIALVYVVALALYFLIALFFSKFVTDRSASNRDRFHEAAFWPLTLTVLVCIVFFYRFWARESHEVYNRIKIPQELRESTPVEIESDWVTNTVSVLPASVAEAGSLDIFSVEAVHRVIPWIKGGFRA